MMRSHRPGRVVLRGAAAAAVTAILFAVAACSDSGAPDSSPLRGLAQATGADSAGNAPPPPAATPTPGYFHGTVLAPSAPGAGNDSLATAPRIAGARVTAYVKVGAGADVELGDEVASVVTGADGRFTLPTFAGGEYVVTIVPPSGSPYGGVWVHATAHSGSHLHPWWVVLWRR